MDRPRSMARCSFTEANLPGGADVSADLDPLFADGAPGAGRWYGDSASIAAPAAGLTGVSARAPGRPAHCSRPARRTGDAARSGRGRNVCGSKGRRHPCARCQGSPPGMTCSQSSASMRRTVWPSASGTWRGRLRVVSTPSRSISRPSRPGRRVVRLPGQPDGPPAGCGMGGLERRNPPRSILDGLLIEDEDAVAPVVVGVPRVRTTR